MFCLQLCMVGCAIRGGGGSSANQRADRLAIETGKLSETTDPVAQTKSYIVIADILLSFAADAALPGASEVVEVDARKGQPLRQELTPASVPVRTFNSQRIASKKCVQLTRRVFNIGVVLKHNNDLENAK